MVAAVKTNSLADISPFPSLCASLFAVAAVVAPTVIVPLPAPDPIRNPVLASIGLST